jgi:glycosyltransferase involved in cell wall biosynthesis
MLAALLMLKNEEASIKKTLLTTRDHFKHIIIYDTGSTDKTIEIIKNVCRRNKQTVHIKEGSFTNFAITRNESIDFAESIAVKYGIQYLVLMDAADEFQCTGTRAQLIDVIKRNCLPKHTFGIVKKQWLTPQGTVEHFDVRFICTGKKCRYDLRYPVHETFEGKTHDNVILLNNLFQLYQNRMLYGESSNLRLEKDIKMLLGAPITKRNYYHIGQTYYDIHDYENAYKYFLMSLEVKSDITEYNFDDMEDSAVLARAMNCAVFVNKDYTVIYDLFLKIQAITDKNIDSYIMLFKYCIDNKLYDTAKQYITKLSELSPTDKIGTSNDRYYSYLRWSLITTVCMNTGDYATALESCKKAVSAENQSIDQVYLQIIQNNLRMAESL